MGGPMAYGLQGFGTWVNDHSSANMVSAREANMQTEKYTDATPVHRETDR